MNKTSMQAAFDTATAAIITQGKRSVSSGGTCQYRGPDGLKCAIGHLMTDEQMERYHVLNSAGALSFSSSLVEELLPGVESDDVELARDFLASLQDAHDLSYSSCSYLSYSGFAADFLERANKVAARFELTPIKPSPKDSL